MIGILSEKSDEMDIVFNPFLFGIDGVSIEEKLRHGYMALFAEILQSSGNNVLSW